MTSVPERRAAQPRAAAPAAAFIARRDIRFSDCDPAGIAYTARLVDLLNGVVEDFFLKALKVDYHAVIRDQKVGLGYAKVDCDFFRPMAMGDAVDFIVLPPRLGGASAVFEIRAYRGETAMLTGVLVMVTTDLVAHRAIALPPPIRAALQHYETLCA